MGQSLDYMRQVLSGLAFAHNQAGSSIATSSRPTSWSRQTTTSSCSTSDWPFRALGSDITRTGLILGSLHYMSPEQVMGERVDARSDIYSVGVTLYQLLTGRAPIDGSSEFAIASGHLKDTPKDPASINPHIPPRLSSIVLKALQKAPADRFQTADQFLQELSSLNTDETRTMLPTPNQSRETSGHAAPRPHSAPPPALSTNTLSGAGILTSITRELALYIGPIAKVVVTRAAKQASTLDELYALVSTEIGTESERKAFLQTRQKYFIEK
jgi:serine/threonine protein kinase